MLLLILLSGCLVLAAGQSTTVGTFGSPANVSVTLANTMTSPVPDPTFHALAIIRTVVQSYQMLNETTITPVLTKISDLILEQKPGATFHLTVKNIKKTV